MSETIQISDIVRITPDTGDLLVIRYPTNQAQKAIEKLATDLSAKFMEMDVEVIMLPDEYDIELIKTSELKQKEI